MLVHTRPLLRSKRRIHHHLRTMRLQAQQQQQQL
jgi:hypothetical protein